MKERSTFLPAETNHVRELMRKVRKVDADEQKNLRSRLRVDVGFYISDFTRSNAGFTEADFDNLVEWGTIKIE